jgi:hypothetical protein
MVRSSSTEGRLKGRKGAEEQSSPVLLKWRRTAREPGGGEKLKEKGGGVQILIAEGSGEGLMEGSDVAWHAQAVHGTTFMKRSRGAG